MASTSRCPYRGMYSTVTLFNKAGIGLRSLLKESAPSRRASSGMDPPPENGSTMTGGSSGWAARTNPLPTFRYSLFAALSQLAKSAMNFRMIRRSPSSDSMIDVHPCGRPCIPRRICRDSFLNASGQCSSQGSGSSNAINTARHEASGLRAHHRCNLAGCPRRLSLAACFETSAMGKSTSASRLHSLGIMRPSCAWANGPRNLGCSRFAILGDVSWFVSFVFVFPGVTTLSCL